MGMKISFGKEKITSSEKFQIPLIRICATGVGSRSGARHFSFNDAGHIAVPSLSLGLCGSVGCSANRRLDQCNNVAY